MSDPALSRRAAIGLLISAGVLPAVSGAFAGPTRAHAAPATTPTFDAPLAELDKPGLTWATAGMIQGPHHRIRFHRGRWTDADGTSRTVITRDIQVKVGVRWLSVSGEDERFDEQWVLHTGEQTTLGAGFYGGADHHWLAPYEISFPSRTVAELTAEAPGLASMTIRWDVSGDNPEIQWSLTAHRDENVVVGYWAGNVMSEDDAEEVLCGARQHARVIDSQVALLSWELFAPMALIQTSVDGTTMTTGVHIPADVLAYEHPRMGYWDDQPFGMSLRNSRDKVQTAVYAPPGGKRSVLTQGSTIGYAFGLVLKPVELYEAQVALSRDEYGFTRYRQNVYGQSMTDAVHNMIDLLAIEPDGDDSVDFIPSVSGWWSRAKGFCNIEGEQQVRTAAASILLSANLLATAGDNARSFWDRRARPMAEHILSRRDIGYSPKQGYGYYTSLCGIGVADVNTSAPVAQLLQGRSGGADHVAMTSLRASTSRVEFSQPLSAYQLTDDPGWLAEAAAIAKRHIRTQIDIPYTTNISTGNFGHSGVKSWLELLVLFDLTGDEEFLRASHREAKRYMGMFHLRPVPDGTIVSPVGEPIDDQWYQWKDAVGVPDYPRDTPPTETVEAWEVSPTGLTFEQLSTYLHASNSPGGGFTLNPIWAPFLTRLADLVDDEFIRDMADAMVVGRFTNYPGYYHRQFISWPAHPQFPIEGPPGTSAIYYHHAPAQLGLALDHLITEHQTRSGGKISFPYIFESVFVYFKYHVYGHQPGEFFGDTEVWPFFPRGIVTVSNPQLNWLTAVSERAFHLSLTNASAEDGTGTITFDPDLTGIDPTQSYEVQIHLGETTSTGTVRDGQIELTVPAHGLVAISIPGAGQLQPWHAVPEHQDRSPVSYHFDDFDGGGGSVADRVYALLIPRPDRTGYEAYLQCSAVDGTDIALRYRVGDGSWQEAVTPPYPYEWSLPVDDLTAPFSYQITVGDKVRPEHTLWLPGTVSGTLPVDQEAGGDLLARGSTTPSDPIEVTARIRARAAISKAEVEVAVPAGWVTDSTTIAVGELGADQTRDVSWTMTPEPKVAIGPRDLKATLTWVDESGAEQEQALSPTTVWIAQPLRLVEVEAPDLRSWGSDDPIPVTVVIANRGPVEQSGTTTLSLPDGWTAAQESVDWTVPARDLVEVELSLVPEGAAPGSTGAVTVTPGAELSTTTLTVGVLDASDQIVVPDQDGYLELGSWLKSSLKGYDGAQSRYSPEGVHGGRIEWTVTIRETGSYEAMVWYPTNGETTTDALYSVVSADGTVEHHVDQTQDADGWVPLSTHEFEEGETVSVTLTAISGLYTRASAARFLKVS